MIISAIPTIIIINMNNANGIGAYINNEYSENNPTATIIQTPTNASITAAIDLTTLFKARILYLRL